MQGGQLTFWPGDEPGERLPWSVSRHRTLESCDRRYYYQYYGSRGGGRVDAPAAVRELFVLKHLRSRFMWVGELVHEMIELMLASWRRGVHVSIDALIERGTRRMRAQYAESVQRLYRERPGQAYGLIEHEYEEPIERDEWQLRRDAMQQCLRTFTELALVRAILDAPTWRWLAVETRGSFDLDGARIVVKPDLVWRAEGDGVEIVDWKTGSAPVGPVDELQLAIYALYAARAWSVDLAHTRAHLVYLARGEVATYEVGEPMLRDAQETATASISRMRALAATVPSGEEAFARTDEIVRCQHCPYRRPCGRS